MRGWKIALLAVLLAACTDEPRHAPLSPLEPANSDYAALVNWFAERGITLPATPPSPDGPAAKAAQDERLLGDASGNGSVSFYDLWVLFRYLSGEVFFAQHFDMDALDIDRDGANDWIDLALLGDFLFGSGENPHGIGQAMEEPASLTPHSDTVSFVADGAWKRFTVQVAEEDSSVVVVVNGLSLDTVSLEISARAEAPGNYCPAERNDGVTASDGDVIWIAGCSEGNSSIFILAQDGTILWSDVSVPVGPSQ